MTPTSPITVFVHIHHPDIWREMCPILAARLDVPFDLVMTGSDPAAFGPPPQTPFLRGVHSIELENRGRDVLPFLRAVAAHPDCTIGLKLHTKKSPQRQDGALWRNALIDGLLPAAGAASIIARLAETQHAGLVGPTDFLLSVQPWVLINAPGMVDVMAALGVELTDTLLQDAFFAAGSMFWFRRTALETLATEAIMALFEPELGQLDGTIAHALERLFAVEALRRGYASLSLAALLEAEPATPLTELLSIARRHADLPTAFFPKAGVAASAYDAKPVARPEPSRLLGRFRRG